MTWTILAGVSLLFALIPAILYARNVRIYREPPRRTNCQSVLPTVSVLVPARNEERSIGAALEALLESHGVEFEVIVLDDHSEDDTAAIVGQFAQRDDRIRLEQAPPLPADWCGKQHACLALSMLARFDVFAFVDADVRLAPDGLARMVGFLESSGAELVSGFPRQETGTFLEKLVIPLIHFLLLGLLPMHRMRRSTQPCYAAGCGQLFVTKRKSYEAIGGHAAVKSSLHDGITLPRAYRRAGFLTDLCDATALATCRMYRSARELWFGLAKNAREGLASAKLIVPVTIMLIVGQGLPLALLTHFVWKFAQLLIEHGADIDWLMSAFERSGVGLGLMMSALATVAAYYPRIDAAKRFRQSPLGAVLHPLGIVVLLAIQWYALLRAVRRGKSSWKGRDYKS
jgi:glycosyltransferase involved in cell wall biosynthesis